MFHSINFSSAKFSSIKKRHIQDERDNNVRVLLYRHGIWLYTTWQKVKVGDIVKVLDREYFPADLVLMSSRLVGFNRFEF